MTTKFIHKVGLGSMTDEEGMDNDRTCILEGLHWMNEIYVHSKAHDALIVAEEMELEKLSEVMKGVHINYQVLKREKNICFPGEIYLGFRERATTP